MPKARTVTARRTTTLRSARCEYTVIFEPAEEGGHVVSLPAPPGVHTEGDTFEEARAMAEDAIRGHLECLRQDGQELPVEHGYPIAHRLSVSPAKV